MSVLRNFRNRLVVPSILVLIVPWFGSSIWCGIVSAQELQQDQKKTMVGGVVLNGVTQAPIARALVSTPDHRFATMTDSSGHFEFDIGKGNFSSTVVAASGLYVTARKPGFLSEGENGTQASPGKEVTLSMTPESLIVGRVTLSTAEAAAGLTVELFSRQVQEGFPRWTALNTVQTNSAGEFRFTELRAGSYRIVTHELLDNDPGAAIGGGPTYGFPPAYYAGGVDFSTASTIDVSAGQTVEADLSLARQPYYNVKMPTSGDPSFAGMVVEVSLQGHKGPGYSLGYNAATHSIEGLLPNGNYVVTATTYGEKSATGTANLKVAGAPAVGPTLTMAPNSLITLNVKEEFTDPQKNGMGSAVYSGVFNGGRQSFSLRGPRLYLNATVEPVDDFGQNVNATIRPPLGPNDDSLVLENVPPGRYWLRLHSGRGYVASATMGATDLLHQPLVVASGATTPIEITLRDDDATLEGTVSGFEAEPRAEGMFFPRAWVYCIPLPDSPGQFEQMGINANGKFSYSVPPGNYRILAFRHPQLNLAYRDAEAMRAYDNKGQVIHLAGGQKASVQVQMIGDE